jgi:putative transposase
MARPLRIEYPGAIYHVLSRGDRREAIFRTEADRKLFLDLLANLPADWVADLNLLWEFL